MVPVPFVILSQPRTGSTLLCSLFNSHPGVRALVEPVNPRTHSHQMRPNSEAPCLLPEQMVQHDIQRALRILFAEARPPEQWIRSRKLATKAAGFKIMAHQLFGLSSEPEFWDYLIANRIKTILCLRHNILLQYVSDLITVVTKQSACYNGEVKTARVLVNVEKLGYNLDRIMSERRHLIDALDKSGLEQRRIYYEDFKDTTAPVEGLLYWLIGERGPLTTKLLKQNPDSLRARVVNYDEVEACVRGLDLDYLLGN